MTEDGDIALIAGQFADLTHDVEEMAKQLQRLLKGLPAIGRVRIYSRTASTLQRMN